MKKFIIALMAFALVITLAGCGGGGGGGGGETPHWGDEGKNLDPAILNDYNVMKNAFDPDTVNALTTSGSRKTYVTNNFTKFVSPTATFMGNDKYTKDKMTSRLTSVLGSYNIINYEFKPGETNKISDTKYTSWVYCVLNAKRKSDNEPRNLGHWMQFTWEKTGDDWYITDGFDNVKWFE